MESIFKITPIKNNKLQKYKEVAIKELNDFFSLEWTKNTPKIFIVDDRRTINLLKEEKTEDWVVGWSWGQRAIFILNPNNISKESCHDGSTYSISKLIKHELGHSFFQSKFGRSNFTWINEGVSVYVAKQLDKYKMPKEFKGFLDGNNIYFESGSAIKLLIDNYGKEKLFEFFEKQSGIETNKELGIIFEKIFGNKLSYEFFNRLKDGK
ncbi:MAG TPA: hypothetical protein PKL88_02900 [bacterium]|nr:hypothetical protein [bacterium]